MSFCLVYMTASSAAEARRIGAALVEARLAACVNMIEGMTSLYRWEGRIEEGREVVVVAKTRRALVPALTAAVKAAHSYTVPCVVALPIEAGNPDFLDWIAAETRAP
ncbi:MAG: divalent-cation tolerance protein CutA [Alphaproteobacteria bacterium]|nr:divalent-cation tolerance protein CutA [Alphaproteobacteria bacterium]